MRNAKKLVFVILCISLCLSMAGCKESSKIDGDWYGDNRNRDHLVINEKNERFSSEYLGFGTYYRNGDNITFSNGFEVIEAVITTKDGQTVIECPEFGVTYYRSKEAAQQAREEK